MTCVVGIEKDGIVYIGADSAAIDAGTLSISTRADEKVFLAGDDEILVGFSGSFRVGQLLRYALEFPEASRKKSPMAFMVTDFMNAVRQLQSVHGALKKENEEESHDGPFLVGYAGKLYCIESDFQVGCPADGYDALGCGSQIALGALFATKNLKLTPVERITLALEAASEYSAGVRKPFRILELKHQEHGE